MQDLSLRIKVKDDGSVVLKKFSGNVSSEMKKSEDSVGGIGKTFTSFSKIATPPLKKGNGTTLL